MTEKITISRSKIERTVNMVQEMLSEPSDLHLPRKVKTLVDIDLECEDGTIATIKSGTVCQVPQFMLWSAPESFAVCVGDEIRDIFDIIKSKGIHIGPRLKMLDHEPADD